MILIYFINARTCVHFVPVSMRLVHRDVEIIFLIRRVLYTRTATKESRSFPNAECDCRTCIDSDLVRLPGRISRPLKGLPLRERERIVSLPFADILESCAREERAVSLNWRVIKFNLFRKDVEYQLPRVSSLPSLADISRSCEVYFCSVKTLYERKASLIFLAFAKLSFFT